MKLYLRKEVTVWIRVIPSKLLTPEMEIQVERYPLRFMCVISCMEEAPDHVPSWTCVLIRDTAVIITTNSPVSMKFRIKII